jgi:hypothetical protein
MAVPERTERRLPAARRVAALAVVAAISLPVAGCGGNEKSFIEGYNNATRPLQTLDGDVAKSLRSASDDSDQKVVANFGRLAERTEKVKDDLADLDAPDDVEHAFDDLQIAVKRYHGDLATVVTGVKTGTVNQTRASVTALSGDAEAVATAEKAVKKKLED